MSRRRIIAVALVVCTTIVVLAVWTRDRAPSGATATDRAHRNPATTSAGAHPMAWSAQRNARARRIAGVVVHDGVPVEGATVRLGSEAAQAGAISEPIIVTATDGRFDFGTQLATGFSVIAEKPRLVPGVAWIDLRDPKAASEDLQLVLHACEASLHGTIRDAAGGVVPHARVALILGLNGASGGAEADDLGVYELCVPIGWGTIVVSAEGYARTIDTVEAFGSVRRDFALVPGATVVGRVVRARDRVPVAAARIELRPEPGIWERLPRAAILYATSDDTGGFHVDGVLPGSYAVTARADGLASARPAYVMAESGETPEPVVCVVAETVTIAGKVLEHGTSAPIVAATVKMQTSRADDEPRSATEGMAFTQADGSFVIDGVLPGEYTPSVQRHELRAQPPNITVAKASVTGVVLEVDRLGSIGGRITHGGKPVEGAEVGLRGGVSRGTVRSGHDGRYELREIAPDSYRIYAESKRVGAFTPGPNLTLAKGEQRTGVDVEMDLAGSIAGVVVDQNAVPVPGVVVSFSLLGGEDFGVATTAEDGTFKAAALSGGGAYVYEVGYGQRSQITYPPAAGKRHPPVWVRDGATRVTGILIKIRREQLAIAGHVLDATGKPVAGARLELAPTLYEGQPAMSDETGAFTIGGLPAGTYNLTATIAGRAAFASTVAAGRSDVVVKFAETGTIEGTFVGFSDEPDITAGRNGTFFRATIDNDTFRIRNLPAGSYRVRATSSTGVAIARSTVSRDAVAKLVLRREGYGTIVGTVIDEVTKQPRVNVFCGATVERDGDEGRSAMTRTDVRGGYRLERVMVGLAQVWCSGAHGSVEVSAGETVRLDLRETPQRAPETPRHPLGLVLEDQLGETRVRSVEAGGPAARAGFLAGDILVKLDDVVVGPHAADFLAIELESSYEIGSTIKVTVDRNDNPVTLTLTIEATP